MGLVLAVPGVAYVVSPLRKKDERRIVRDAYPAQPARGGSSSLVRHHQGTARRLGEIPSRAGGLGLADPPAGREQLSRLSPSRPSALTWAARSISRPTRRGFSVPATPAHSTSRESPPTRSRRGRWIDLKVELTEGDDPEIRVKFERFRTQSEEQQPLV